MSIFASRVTRTVPLPFDPPHEVTIRALAGRHLEKAQQERQFASNDYVQRMGGEAFRKQLASARKEMTKEELAKADADPTNAFDRRTVLYKGIESWTYPESLKPVPLPGIAVAIEAAKAGDLDKALALVMQVVESRDYAETIPAIDDLSEEAADFLAEQILRLSKPALFQSKAEKIEAQGNA
jgi:hypothetical protein